MSSENQQDIARRHYASDTHLRLRQQTHNKYTVPDISFPDWVLDRSNIEQAQTILDIGAGTGLYYKVLQQRQPDAKYIAIDLLPSMMTHHDAFGQADSGLASANVSSLPFSDNTFDLIMANHMMHHVDNQENAIQEIQRVLKPNGVLTVATNSTHTMPQLQVLMRRAIVLLTRSGPAQVNAPQMPTDRFSLENGTRILSQAFFAVVRHDLPGDFVFPDVEPAMAYLESTRDLREPYLPDDVMWDDVMMIMRQQITQLVRHLGEFRITKLSGVLIASDAGGFIQQFSDILETQNA